MPKLLANAKNVHIEEVGQCVVVLIKKMFIKLSPADDLSFMQREILEDRIFASCENDRLTCARNRPSADVDPNITQLKLGIRLSRRATNQSAEPRQQF